MPSTTGEDQERKEWARNRTCGVHRLDQSIGRADAVTGHRLRDHHGARGAARAFRKAIDKADRRYLPPPRYQRQQRLNGIRDDVAGHHQRLAARPSIRKISREKLC